MKFYDRKASVSMREERSEERRDLPSFLSSNRKKIPECAIIRAQRSCRLRGRHRRRRHRRYPRLRCRSVVTVVPRYDNFTFIDRSGRTSLYLSFHPPFLSLVSLFRFASLSLLSSSPSASLSSSLLVRSRAPSARFLFTVLVV